jgi:hypothetical protein
LFAESAMAPGIRASIGRTPLVQLRRVVPAAIRLARRLGPGRTVATLACESGLKYLSTDPYPAD